MQQSHEVVCRIRSVLARVQLPGQREERLGLLREERDVKDGGGVWDVVVLQVVIETSPGSPVQGDIIIIEVIS